MALTRDTCLGYRSPRWVKAQDSGPVLGSGAYLPSASCSGGWVLLGCAPQGLSLFPGVFVSWPLDPAFARGGCPPLLWASGPLPGLRCWGCSMHPLVAHFQRHTSTHSFSLLSMFVNSLMLLHWLLLSMPQECILLLLASLSLSLPSPWFPFYFHSLSLPRSSFGQDKINITKALNSSFLNRPVWLQHSTHKFYLWE